MDVYIGTIMTFGFSYAPSSWALCNGQLLPLTQYQALFALLGVTYGGNGSSNFQLPNFQGRLPMAQGQGLSLSNRVMGESDGVENASMTLNNLPNHTHTVTSTLAVSTTVQFADASTSNVIAPTAVASYLGGSTGGPNSANIFATGLGATPVTQKGITSSLSGGVTIAATGNGQPLSVLNPFLVVNFSIALLGIFPSRN